jgi:hypothetical protein
VSLSERFGEARALRETASLVVEVAREEVAAVLAGLGAPGTP